MSDLGTRLANTGQLLLYSGIEIDRILKSMVDDRSAVSVAVPGQSMVLSRLLRVDPVRQRVMMAQSDRNDANAVLLKLPSVNLRCHHRLGQFAFACGKPRVAELAGEPAIMVKSPTVVLALQHNKKAVAAAIAKVAPDLRCQLPVGAVVHEARLVDLSLDGHAFVMGDGGVPISAGAWIRGARITPPGEPPVSADIEIKYVIPSVQSDGEPATRIGCRIVGETAVMEKLVSRFVVDVG